MTGSIRKIIVDSRYFVSGDASSGVYELPEIVEIHRTQALYLEQLSLMNTWFSVDETNNQLYLVEWTDGITGQDMFNRFRPRIITMPIESAAGRAEWPGQVAQSDLQRLPDLDRPHHGSHQRSAGSKLHDHTHDEWASRCRRAILPRAREVSQRPELVE